MRCRHIVTDYSLQLNSLRHLNSARFITFDSMSLSFSDLCIYVVSLHMYVHAIYLQEFYELCECSHLRKLQQTRRMAIANGTFVSFCNQPKAHYLATI